MFKIIKTFKSTGITFVVLIDSKLLGDLNHLLLKSQPDSAPAAMSLYFYYLSLLFYAKFISSLYDSGLG